MDNYNIPLNLPQRYQKGIMSHFGVMVAPFYQCNEVIAEGAPVVLDAANAGFVKAATAGFCENGVFGLIAQQVYDPAVLGALSGYTFHNNTWAKKGDTVGVIVGQGYVNTINYTGTIVAGDKLYVGANAVLTKVQTGADLPVGVAETAGEDGATYIRVRVNFNWYADAVEDSNSQ
jgi:hypothetical protein